MTQNGTGLVFAGHWSNSGHHSNTCSISVYAGSMQTAHPRRRTSSVPDRSSRPPVSPPGWPAEVRPPGAPDWEVTAAAWLLDLCPPEYRSYPALRRHAVVLARFAVLHVEACQAAVNQGLSEARGDLRDVAEGAVVEAAVETWQRESARLLGVRRAVGLV
jgi:hypothetical protein